MRHVILTTEMSDVRHEKLCLLIRVQQSKGYKNNNSHFNNRA